MIGKLVGGVMGARIAENSGKSGALGAAVGYVASRIVRRSPIGALVLGGAWLGHKLYKRNQERTLDTAARNAKPAKVVKSEPSANKVKAPKADPASS